MRTLAEALEDLGCDRRPADIDVMEQEGGTTWIDAGTAEHYFGDDDVPLIMVGEAQGEDQQRGAYDWWALTLRGKAFGELRDTAAGYAIYITNWSALASK
jgi:hypothetical protein